MRLSPLLSILLSSSTTARIVGVAAPDRLAPGAAFNLTLLTSNYIQTVLDVSAAAGLSDVVFPDTLGNYVGSFYLGPDQSNILTNITSALSVPTWQPLGPTNLYAAVTSLYGASSSPTTIIWSLPVTIANSTDGAGVISTTDGANACATSLPSASTSSSAAARM